eukprot:scaffold89814_cov35-Tisochrysis_lutea.AAC.1
MAKVRVIRGHASEPFCTVLAIATRHSTQRAPILIFMSLSCADSSALLPRHSAPLCIAHRSRRMVHRPIRYGRWRSHLSLATSTGTLMPSSYLMVPGLLLAGMDHAISTSCPHARRLVPKLTDSSRLALLKCPGLPCSGLHIHLTNTWHSVHRLVGCQACMRARHRTLRSDYRGRMGISSSVCKYMTSAAEGAFKSLPHLHEWSGVGQLSSTLLPPWLMCL